MRSGKEAQKTIPMGGREPSVEDFIYFAGLFDGEGSIDVSTGRIRTPRLKVAMTDGPTIDWLYETFGGNMCHENPSGTAKLAAWKWYAVRQVDVKAILTGARPYLKLKARRADAALDALEYLSYASGPSYSDDAWLDGLYERVEKCYARAWLQRSSATMLARAQD